MHEDVQALTGELNATEPLPLRDRVSRFVGSTTVTARVSAPERPELVLRADAVTSYVPSAYGAGIATESVVCSCCPAEIVGDALPKDPDQPIGNVVARFIVSGAQPAELVFCTVTLKRAEAPYAAATPVGEADMAGVPGVHVRPP